MNKQPRLKVGRRGHLGSAVLAEIREAVQAEAERCDCSKSFVVATILADHFGIVKQPSYRDVFRAMRATEEGRVKTVEGR